MKKYLLLLLLLGLGIFGQSQETLLKAGDRFPDLLITNITNAPKKEHYINDSVNRMFYLLNFWGTWCSPCIPEMDHLTIIQKNNTSKLQVIAVSDDDAGRKANYLKKKPSSIWLSTDTSYTLYNMLGLANVGQCILISPEKKIVAVLKTESITQALIDKLLRGQPVISDANIKTPDAGVSDDFGVDSLVNNSFCIRGYMNGKRGMRRNRNETYFNGRRITAYNSSLLTLYMDVFDIHSSTQTAYDSSVSKKEVADYENKKSLYCMDILVEAGKKNHINDILYQYLSAVLPVKARLIHKKLPVYVLKVAGSGMGDFIVSKDTVSSYGFSGRGYEGTGIFLKDFAKHYLTNELNLPVLDETGLAERYDIKFSINLRDKETLKDVLSKNGLTLEKAEREVPVIYFYK
ncbi:MAG: thioredoxin-like domain-containing protein [Ferruginibacter sp.]